MTTKEAIFYLEAILEDTLDPHDETDPKRIEAVELTVRILESAGAAALSTVGKPQRGRS